MTPLLLFIPLFLPSPSQEPDSLKQFESFYEEMAPAYEQSPDAFIWISGYSHPLFNVVMRFSYTEDAGERIDDLLAKNPRLPMSFWVQPQSRTLPTLLNERGFQLVMSTPLMEWEVVPIPATEWDIRPADMTHFETILGSVFHFDASTLKNYMSLFKPTSAEHYLIYHYGRPIGTGTLFPYKGIGGIFNISTLEAYQKQGYGCAMMKFLMNRASQLYLKKLILQSSPMAVKLYTDLGFKKCFDVNVYAKNN
jgi:ribosomal protein S18 acetylase RimI-like enzyme